MAKYLDPKTDVTFKKVFGEHPDILKSFLSGVLPLPKGTEIESLNYLTPELLPKNPKGKDSIVDVRCIDKNGNTFIVEMQMYWTSAFKKRALYNTCKAYSYPLEKGSQYAELKKVYTVSIVNNKAFNEYPDEYYHIFTLVHHKHNDVKIDDIMLVFIELPKFQEQDDKGTELMSLWLRFLTEINDKTKEVSPELLKNTYISKAVSLVEESAYSVPELVAIEKYWDAVSRERTALSEWFSEGEAIGEAKGEAKGEVKGEAKGIAKVAKNMKAKNMPICDIVELTGLTEEEVSKL